jgi:uncharacterized protein YqeY
MGLKDKINEDLKEAMKSKDKVKLNTIRSLRASILEFEKSGIGKDITKEDEIKMLSSAAKKRREALEQYEKAGREDLAQNEKKELAIIESYLPRQLSNDEIETKVKEIAERIGAESKADFGKLMGTVIKELKGQADGNIIREIVTKVLN